jgi:hypothetical protein
MEKNKILKSAFGTMFAMTLGWPLLSHARTECDKAREQVANWKGHQFDWKSANLSLPEVQQALHIIDSFHYPKPGEVEAAEAALHKEIRNLSPYSQRVMNSDCVKARLQLMTGLVATAVSNPALKARIRTGLLAIFKKPMFATYLTASTDVDILEFAAQKKLWNFDADQMKKIADLKTQIKTEVHNAKVGSADLWRKFDNRSFWSASNDELAQLKPFVFDEMELSHRVLQSVGELLSSAKGD